MATKTVRRQSIYVSEGDGTLTGFDTVDAAFPCRYLRFLPLVGLHLAPLQAAGYRVILTFNGAGFSGFMLCMSILLAITFFDLLSLSLRAAGVVLVALVLFMRETRRSVVLARIARNLRKRTGNEQYKARVEIEKQSLKSLLIVSCTRPLCKYFSLLLE
jgi:hypothetical protein